MGREYVPIFFDWLEVTQDLTPEEKGNLIDAVVAYASGQEYEHYLTGGCKIAFRFLKGQVDRNAAISDARSKAGSNKREQPETNANKPEQTGTKFPKEKDKEKEEDKEKDKERVTERKPRFSPPTLEEVTGYCRERGNGVNPQRFIDYYQARGWELKPGQKVKDWRACVRTWENHSAPSKTVNAQQYAQRDYSGSDSLTDVMSVLQGDMRA